MERLIFHVDVNSAFLSWEATRRVNNGEPDLRLIPSCVGGSPDSRRSVVVAKSIPAKKFDIKTGEPVSMALKKCPGLVVVQSDFRLYKACSKAFKDICREYAPAVEEFSIDECFMDMSGTSLIYPNPIKTAHELKDRIKNDLGFTVNIGIGRNKLCAKMAGDFEKPDKVHTLFPEEIPKKMWPLPVGDLLFVGNSTVKKLNEIGIKTIGELAHADLKYLTDQLGYKMGNQAYRYANGLDDSPVKGQPDDPKGYSNEVTLEDDVISIDQAERILLALADSVTSHMRKDGVKAYCVAVKIRYLDFRTRSHQRKLSEPTDVSGEVYEIAKELLKELWKDMKPLRLMGIALTDVSDGSEPVQMTMFREEEELNREKGQKLDKAIDSLRNKYGSGIITRGSLMELNIKIGKKNER